MAILFQKMTLTVLAFVWALGCSQVKTDNSDNIEALTAHLVKLDRTIKVTPMIDAFAGLIQDPEQKKKMIDEAGEGYARMNIKNIYLVTGATAETNETVIGSLIHFKDDLTLDQAKALLAKDENYKKQDLDMVMNGHFAFAVSTINGKTVTPKSVLAAFKDFK